MGLDHPLLQDALAKWRDLPPEDIGIAVSGGVESPVMLSIWTIETSDNPRCN
jgi:tRNA(Ile)-lysidine synthase TilS/MesJ